MFSCTIACLSRASALKQPFGSEPMVNKLIYFPKQGEILLILNLFLTRERVPEIIKSLFVVTLSIEKQAKTHAALHNNIGITDVSFLCSELLQRTELSKRFA